MRIVAVCLVAMLSVVLVLPAFGQTARVVAVADFVDESVDGNLVSAPQLSAMLQRFLVDRGGGRLRVVDVERVRAALRTAKFSPSDLIYPSRAVEIAKAVGADWIITGRWTHLDIDEDFVRPSFPETRAMIELRVLDVATRRILLEDSFYGQATGRSLTRAAEQALRAAADRIAKL